MRTRTISAITLASVLSIDFQSGILGVLREMLTPLWTSILSFQRAIRPEMAVRYTMTLVQEVPV
jgi:hypothetical protein